MRSVAEQTDHSRVLALKDLHNAPFRASIWTPPPNARKNAVAVHCIVDAVAWDEEVAIHTGNRRVWDHEPVSLAVSDNAPLDEMRIARSLRRFDGNERFFMNS